MISALAIDPRARNAGTKGAAVLLFALLFAVAGRTPACAADSEWAAIAVPERVTAGELLALEFGIAPPGVDELEILLSLDDGRTFPVRASREIEPRERSVRWKVPALASARARLRIRYHCRGREIPGPVSAPFTIASNRQPAELALFHESGWWEGIAEDRDASASADLDSGAPRLVEGSSTEPLALPSAPPSMIDRAPARSLLPVESPLADRPAAPSHRAIRERSYPLRN